MIGRTNAGSGGALNKSTIIVTAPTGSTVTCNSGNITRTAPEKNGSWTFYGLDVGTWTITATKSGQTATKSVTITRLEVEYVTISYNQIPEFTYTGDYEIVDDADTPITTSDGNWKIRFLTSGTLTFTNLNGAENGIDVFLVGGGGSGRKGGEYWAGSSGGGGYTTTQKEIHVALNVDYPIVVGAGGTASETGTAGGKSSALGYAANGGGIGQTSVGGGTTAGGDGGSGGVAAFHTRGDSNSKNKLGGTDGGDAETFSNSHSEMGGTVTSQGGKGQGTTTREFGSTSGKLYSNGGNAYGRSIAVITNSGNGGSGSSVTDNRGNNSVAAVNGSSGIVIIRNHRA